MSIRIYKFRTKRVIESYKSIDSYLNAVYRANRHVIDTAQNRWNAENGIDLNPKAQFKRLVKNQMFDRSGKRVMSLKKAIDTVTHQKYITSDSMRFQENLYTNLTKDKQLFNAFRRQTGWNKKIDINRFEYQGHFGAKNHGYAQYTYTSVKRINGKFYTVVTFVERDDSPKGNGAFRVYSQQTEVKS